jgi:type III pantothenate kinase
MIDNPDEVGDDRIVNAVAAFDKYHTALIIVDFGTAITFDCVSGRGEYLGGIITPGVAISLDALSSRTAKLPRVDITIPPAQAIGTNTVDAIKSGIMFGYGGLVEELVRRIKAEMAPQIPRVIATGGMAPLIAPHAPSIEVVEPMLTLEGLRLLHERNS